MRPASLSDWSLRRGAAGVDVVALRLAQLGILVGIAVENQEGEKIQKAQGRREAEAPPPAERDADQGDERHPDDVREFRGGVEDRRRQRPLLAREPIARRFRVGRKGRRFGDAKDHASGEDPAESAGDGNQQRRAGPKERADPADQGDAETVQHKPGRDLQQRIGPEERAEQQPHLSGGETEFVLQLRPGDRQIDAVEIVDEHADAEQHANAPPPPGDPLG